MKKHNKVKRYLFHTTRGSVICLIFICWALILPTLTIHELILARKFGEIFEGMYIASAAQTNNLTAQNEALKDKLARSATYQTPEDVKALSRWYIQKYFGTDAEIVERVMICESGLDPRRVHTNQDGSTDSGLYQIHDEPTHRKNIEKMYGMPFELAVYDLEVSSKYSKFLWDRSPRNWVCYSIINK